MLVYNDNEVGAANVEMFVWKDVVTVTGSSIHDRVFIAHKYFNNYS
jgi:hypothetical protein